MATPIGYFFTMAQVKTMHDKPAYVQTLAYSYSQSSCLGWTVVSMHCVVPPYDKLFSPIVTCSSLLQTLDWQTLFSYMPQPSLVPRPSAPRPFGKLEREKWFFPSPIFRRGVVVFFPLQFSEGAWCGGSGDETSHSLCAVTWHLTTGKP